MIFLWTRKIPETKHNKTQDKNEEAKCTWKELTDTHGQDYQAEDKIKEKKYWRVTISMWENEWTEFEKKINLFNNNTKKLLNKLGVNLIYKNVTEKRRQ